MTLSELNEICKRNNIKEDVKLLSDSGWECCETDMDGVWYSEIEHVIVFTQGGEYEKRYILGRGAGSDFKSNESLERLK